MVYATATTNRGIADWGSIFDDTTVAAAILDRLLHHATVLTITGDSYRMRRHRDTIKALRPALTGRQQGGDSRDHTWGIPVILDSSRRPPRGESWLRALPWREDLVAHPPTFAGHTTSRDSHCLESRYWSRSPSRMACPT